MPKKRIFRLVSPKEGLGIAYAGVVLCTLLEETAASEETEARIKAIYLAEVAVKAYV